MSANQNILRELKRVQDLKQYSEAQEIILLEKALKSDDPNTLIAGQQMWLNKTASQREQKSLLLDPSQLAIGNGYSEKPIQISYQFLRQMAKVPLIRTILETRKDQVSNFSNPSDDESKPGWMIRRKKKLFDEKRNEVDDSDKRIIEAITNWLMNCGTLGNKFVNDDFDSFARKFIGDSLTLDSATFEVVMNRKKQPLQVVAVDGATFRWLDLRGHEHEYEEIDGILPNICQIFNGQIVNTFYPWELCLGIRNPSTSVYTFNYGSSELEDLVRVVTWMLYSDEYNGKFFSQGAAPKGILKLSGNVNNNRLQEFKQQWQSTVAGVQNAWKTPVLEAEKMEWIDLQKSNADMQFREWNQYLISITCAVFKISPEEIGFSQNSGGSSSLFNTGLKERLDFSKEKGLVPLLKFIQNKINKHIVSLLNPDFEFIYTGISPEDESAKADLSVKKLQFMTFNEIRAQYNLPPIKGGDIIANSAFLQGKQMDMMGSPDSNQAVDEMTGEQPVPDLTQQPGEETQKSFQDNPIFKTFTAKVIETIQSEK